MQYDILILSVGKRLKRMERPMSCYTWNVVYEFDRNDEVCLAKVKLNGSDVAMFCRDSYLNLWCVICYDTDVCLIDLRNDEYESPYIDSVISNVMNDLGADGYEVVYEFVNDL